MYRISAPDTAFTVSVYHAPRGWNYFELKDVFCGSVNIKLWDLLQSETGMPSSFRFLHAVFITIHGHEQTNPARLNLPLRTIDRPLIFMVS